MPRAYDLVGDVTTPAEVFPRLEALERMAMTLAFADPPTPPRKLLTT